MIEALCVARNHFCQNDERSTADRDDFMQGVGVEIDLVRDCRVRHPHSAAHVTELCGTDGNNDRKTFHQLEQHASNAGC